MLERKSDVTELCIMLLRRSFVSDKVQIKNLDKITKYIKTKRG